jgi:hypothetical protein
MGMWTLEENPNCEKTHVSFRLVGEGLLPRVVERVTGLAGDFSAAKDEVRRSRTGREIRQRTGVWLITSKGQVDSTSVERHLICLLEKLEPVKKDLLAVAREQGVEADFVCY